MSKRISLTAQAHDIIQNDLNAGDIAIDATIGNGHDTLFLANQVGEQGMVFGFDRQQQAIESTQSRLDSHNIDAKVNLIHASHCKMDEFIPSRYQGKIKTIVFNLGYLPGSDKTLITQADSTLIALNKAIDFLAPEGIISLIAYPGHAGGEEETYQITDWLQQLHPYQYQFQTIFSSEKNTDPRLFIIKKVLIKE